MNPATVLVVDNDEALVELQAFVLEERGHTVHRATDGRAGIELAVRHRPNVIVCDLVMADVHGFDVLAAVRADPTLARTVVIVTSAHRDRADIERARALGAADYLIKPFELEELVTLVDQHLSALGTTERP